MTFRNFLIKLVIGTSFFLVIIAVLNRVIDPFWFYQDIELEGINIIKPKYSGVERYIKPQILLRDQPQAIILGNSYSEIGFNPDNTIFTNHGKLESYNFAFAASDWARTQCYLEYALKHALIKRAVIGIFSEPLPIIDCEGQLPEIEEFSEIKLLLSFNALRSSISTLSKQHKAPTHASNGMLFFNRGKAGVKQRFNQFLTHGNTLKENCNYMDILNTNNYSVQMQQQLPESSNINLDGLERIMRIADEQNVELKFYIYPAHAHKMELDIICGSYIHTWRNLAAIAELIDKTSYKAEVWAFFGFNKYTTEQISNNNPKYWQDPMHFNYELGDLLYELMFQNKLGGQLKLNSISLKNRYAGFLAERKAFIGEKSKFLTDLKTVLEN